MKIFNKLLGARAAAIWGMVLVMVTVAGVYLAPRGDASGEWIYVKEGPVVRIAPTPIPNKRNTVVTIAGVGFEPNEELGLRIEMGGVTSEIRNQVKPMPKTDDEGAFMTEWKIGREIGMLDPGVITLRVVNANGDVVAHAPFVLAKAEKKSKK